MIDVKSYGVAKGSTRTGSVSGGGGTVIYNSTTTVDDVAYADEAGYASEAGTAEKADYATSAGAASTADYATSAGNAVHANIADEIADDSELYERFLRKDVADTAAGLIDFLAGLTIATDNGIDSSGDATLNAAKFKSTITALENVLANTFDEDAQAGFGMVAQNSAATKYKLFLHSLEVWGKAIFHELEVRKLSYVGGDYVFSPAGSEVFKVEEVEEDDAVTGYKCWLLADDGTTATENNWKLYDQAMCQTFDVVDGTTYDAENRYYWRLVTAVSDSNECLYDDDGNELYDGQKFGWIVLSASVCDTGSDVPAAGDSICCMGHRLYDDTEAAGYRQGIIKICTSGEQPQLLVYAGVSSFSLTDNVVADIGSAGVVFNSEFFSFTSGGINYRTLIWCGEWTEGVTYPYYAQVTYNGATYVCVNEDGTTEEPGTGDDWLCTSARGYDAITITPSMSLITHKKSTDETVTIDFTVMEGSTTLAYGLSATAGTAGVWTFAIDSLPDGVSSTAVSAAGGVVLRIASGYDINDVISFTFAITRADGTATTQAASVKIATIEDTGYDAIQVNPSRAAFIHHYGEAETLTVSFAVYEGNTALSYSETGVTSCWRISYSQIDEKGDGTLEQTIEADEDIEKTLSYTLLVYRSDGTTYSYNGAVACSTVYDSVNGEDGAAAWGVMTTPAVLTLETDDDGVIESDALGVAACYSDIKVVQGNDYYALSSTNTAVTLSAENCTAGYTFVDGGLRVYISSVDDGAEYEYTDTDGSAATYVAPAASGSISVVLSVTADGSEVVALSVVVPFTVIVNKFVSNLFVSNKSISLKVDEVTDGLAATGIDIENKTVTITADAFKVQDNSENERIATTSEGDLAMTGYNFGSDGETVENTVSTSLDGKGFMLIHSGGAFIQLGFDADGSPFCVGYYNDGSLAWSLPAKALDFSVSLYHAGCWYSESATASANYSTYTFLIALEVYNESSDDVTFDVDNITCVCREGLTDYNTLTLQESVSIEAGGSADRLSGCMYLSGSIRVKKTTGYTSSYHSAFTFTVKYNDEVMSTLGVVLAAITKK